jgi:hypothetical protein
MHRTEGTVMQLRFAAFSMICLAATALVPSMPATRRSPPPRAAVELSPQTAQTSAEAVSVATTDVHSRLLQASQLLQDDGRVTLSRDDIELALADMHLQRPTVPRTGHPSEFLPQSLYAGAPAVDVTELVVGAFPRVLEAHPIFRSMAEELLGNDDWYRSVYFGGPTRDESSLSFEQLCRRLVASVYVFEALIALDRDAHSALARWYEDLYAERRAAAAAAPRRPPRSARDALMGFFLALKGESVLASINAFEMMRRLSARRGAGGGVDSAGAGDHAGTGGGADARAGVEAADDAAQHRAEVRGLSDVLNAIMSLNIFEAVLSNLSFAFWPDNARAGMALLEAPAGAFREDGTQALDAEWFTLYLAWNANFIWPSHFCKDMMCFTMLAMPTIALGSPEAFQYHRAHSLFWVVRSTQLTRLARDPDAPLDCFRCRQLEPATDRQPLTSRTAKLTRASGEALARKAGFDVSEGSGVWWRLATEVLPQQVRSAARLYERMPKASPTKLRLL